MEEFFDPQVCLDHLLRTLSVTELHVCNQRLKSEQCDRLFLSAGCCIGTPAGLINFVHVRHTHSHL